MKQMQLVLTRVVLAAGCLFPITERLGATPLKIDYTGGPTIVRPPGRPDIPVPHKHVPSEDYKVGANDWRVSLVPDPPEYLRTADAATLAVIAADLRGRGWSFSSSVRELSNDSLIVRWYEAVYEDPCVNNPALPPCVGANFGLDYVPGVGDPADIHWIQVVKSNHRRGARHGVAEHNVDEAAPGRVYIDNGFLLPTFFIDTPRREHNMEHEWTAWTFLVTGPPINADMTVTPGDVTFWGGVKWGWTNACVAPAPGPAPIAEAAPGEVCEIVPEPSTFVSGALALAVLAGYYAKRQRRKYDIRHNTSQPRRGGELKRAFRARRIHQLRPRGKPACSA